ncbi:uncharacterized protein [Littorina saxatilis]|uniref:Homeobox domain-containing protein n=1 Tax=Littorina saxatilis TaxID=31220 RepID=A0AAN9BPC7_9CAEN
MAVVATSTPKRHGFSIESLIGRRDDSPRRHAHVLLPRPEDFSATRGTDSVSPIREGESVGRERVRDSFSRVDSSRDSGKDAHRDSLRDLNTSPKESRESFRELQHRDPAGPRDLHRDSLRDRELSLRDSARDQMLRDTARELSLRNGARDQTQRDSARDQLVRESGREQSVKDSSFRPRSRPGTISPSSTTDEERTAGRRTSSPASPPVTSPRLDKTLSPASPEAENRLSGWSSEDFKHLLGTGAFHHQAHHHGVGVDGSSLYPPLRVCNRSLSAAMSSAAALLPHQFGGLPVNPLSFYNFHRELGHHPATHPLLAARYPGGFVHPRYPLGPPPGLLFHPYRKPKRNRTAFSPSQLLQLEQAFEKNHYVVGQERKTLAGKLQLSETQVKVWFQNRRTKHKRMKAEEEATGGCVTSGDDVSKAGNNSEGHMDAKSDVEDHELLDDDVCTSDEELSVTEDS